MFLLDGGSIVALLDRSDRHHRRCAAQLVLVREAFGTTWPVIAEALARMDGVRGGGEAVWELLERSQCRLLSLESGDFDRLRQLSGGPGKLSLAQASLVCVAERDGIDAIFTLDSRLAGRRKGRRKLFRRWLGGSAPRTDPGSTPTRLSRGT